MRCSGLVQDTVIEEPLVRSPGRIVALAHAGPIPLLAGKLAYGSQKVELQADERVQAPEGGEGSPGAVAVVANAAAHGQPVSLFDVGLVVLLVAAASRKAHSSPLAPVVKRVVDELTAVVCVQLAEGHWQTPRCFFYSSTHTAHPDAPDGLDFRPARRYVHHSQRRQEKPIQALTAVQHQVRLYGTRLDSPSIRSRCGSVFALSVLSPAKPAAGGCRPSRFRQLRSWRSIVAALIETSASRTFPSRRSSPCRSSPATNAGNTAASSLPHIRSPASHTFTRASFTS